MSKGTVKFFNATKGWGFISDDESGKDIFVHVTGLIDKVIDGESVTFDIEDGNRGVKAVNVRRLSTQEMASGTASEEEDMQDEEGSSEQE